MNDTMLISIIIPAYNQSHYLGQAIESAISQTYAPIEIIVVDDGSTDDTRAVAAAYADSRLRYLYQENRGLSAARNTGLRHARGELLTFLDSDDLFLPQKLEHLAAKLSRDPQLGLVAGQAIPIDEAQQPVGAIFDQPPPEDGKRLLLGNPLHVGSILLRRSWQASVGYFDETLRSYEDWDMWLRLAHAGCPMGWVNVPVSLYRFHRHQMTRDGNQMTTATFAVLDKLFARSDLPQSWRDMRDVAYSRAYLRAAAQSYRMKHFSAGATYITKAVSLDPRLASNNGQQLLDNVVGWTELPKIESPLDFLEGVFGNLPLELSFLSQRKSDTLGEVALRLAFSAYERGDMRSARRASRRALQYQPRYLGNRGALAVLLHSHIAR